MLKIQVNCEQLGAAYTCSATKDVRYYLNGVHITPGRAEATDGHRLIRIDAENITFETDRENEHGAIVSLPKEAIADMKKAGFRGVVATITSGEAGATIEYGSTRRECQIIDGTFPETDRIMPSEVAKSGEDLAEGAFNSRYLADAHVAAKILSGSKDAIVELSPRGTSAMLVRIHGPAVTRSDENARLATMVIMPVRL